METKKFQFNPDVVPTKNEVCKIQIIDNRYWSTEIYGWYDNELNQFYYTYVCGDCACRGYIDPLSVVSWEYKYNIKNYLF